MITWYLYYISDIPATWYGLPVSHTDVLPFLSDTTVLHFDTDFNYIDGVIIVNHIMSLYASQNCTV